MVIINMRNSKGQVLVIFILLLPVILMIFALIIDVGLLYSEKRKLDNTVLESINYRFDNISLEDSVLEEKITILLGKNIDDIEVMNIDVSSNYIKIGVIKSKESLFANVFKKAVYEIKSSYIGKIENKKIIIKES